MFMFVATVMYAHTSTHKSIVLTLHTGSFHALDLLRLYDLVYLSIGVCNSAS